MAGSLTILHLAPHPDDEAIGAPATLLELRAGGHQIINHPCSFGRPGQAEARRAELEEACRRADFELDRRAKGFPLSRGDDLVAAQRGLTEEVRERIVCRQVDVLIAPSPHDGHHGREVVGRAACDAVEASGDGAPRLWLWGLWPTCRRVKREPSVVTADGSGGISADTRPWLPSDFRQRVQPDTGPTAFPTTKESP